MAWNQLPLRAQNAARDGKNISIAELHYNAIQYNAVLNIMVSYTL